MKKWKSFTVCGIACLLILGLLFCIIYNIDQSIPKESISISS